MEYAIEKHAVVCKNGGGEQTLPNIIKYTETADFVYFMSATKNTLIKRGWRGDVRVDYIVTDIITYNRSIITEHKWIDLILIKIEATTNKDWKYVFAKK